MYDHHAASIENIKAYFTQDEDVLALLLTGSIAHGFEKLDSDVDVLVVLTEEAYQARLDSCDRTFVRHDLCTYQGGFVDGKYISLSFIQAVAEKGSEPARWSFEGARVLFSRNLDSVNLEEELKSLVRYPVSEKVERIIQFRTQLEIWRWYCAEGRKKENAYLLNVAVGKLVLFGGRLMLAHNEMLYPYHKWFPKVLSQAPELPDGFMERFDAAVKDPSEVNTQGFYDMVVGFREWERPKYRFGAQFAVDSELNWLYLKTPVDDV
ncbi:hypothetical protein B0H66DRAFT_373170 [Apodospora peruviana]|uniref:Polymerase beta nucleotidyltransferase domain-containing protein n=1 Tax=Apodospora peruviana TaxID=516989 RepID=A0AAE0M0A2_9PEZI|nr:hypothetical protein B0H66DRAFT_373170 [Apodospora peruviana]